MTTRPAEIIAEALSATTNAEVGGEPVTDVYRPEGLALLIIAKLAEAGWEITSKPARPRSHHHLNFHYASRRVDGCSDLSCSCQRYTPAPEDDR